MSTGVETVWPGPEFVIDNHPRHECTVTSELIESASSELVVLHFERSAHTIRKG